MAVRHESYASQELLRSSDLSFFNIELYDVQLLLVATVILAAAIGS